MKFPKLEIENFLAITKAEIDLADRGLIAIQGENKADTSANSNGAGKSSIADALCWCWFGTTARGASGDDVINNTVGKGCRVSSSVVDGGITYTATRHRKHPKGKNSLHLTMHDGLTETDLTKGTDKLTQVEADKVIGSSLEVFAGSIYAGQEKMPDLPAMTDKTLKMLIEEAAGVTLLEEAYKKARDGMAAAQTAHSHAEIAHGRLAVRRDQLQNDQTTNNFNIKSWEDDRAKRVTDNAVEVKCLITQIKTTDLEIAAFGIETVEKAIAAIDTKIAGVAGENIRLAELEGAVAHEDAALASVVPRKAQVELDIATRELELSGVQKRLGTPCNECGRPLTAAELVTTQSVAEKRVRIAKDDLDALVEHIAASQKRLAERTTARDTFRASMTDISAEQIERQKLDTNRQLHARKTSDRAVLMTKAQGLKAQIEAMRAEKNPYAANAQQIEDDLAQAEKDLTEAIAKKKAAEVALDVEKEVVRVFSPAGVRARILDEVTPFLNTQTSKYLTTLSDGNIVATWSTLTPAAKKGEFKEKFSIEVANTTGGGSFKTLSGGEKRKTRIATALALQDLVATRASKPIDLFIGDEIDDALDASGLERLMIILDEKAKERGSVFVISHNDLADSIRQIMTIEKLANGETRITEVAA